MPLPTPDLLNFDKFFINKIFSIAVYDDRHSMSMCANSGFYPPTPKQCESRVSKYPCVLRAATDYRDQE